jgi:hypothetical protein
MQESTSGSKQIVWNVTNIRRAVAYAAFGYPLALLIGFAFLQGWPPPDSISTYYYSSLHYVFLGGLVGLGVLLIYYQYRDDTENNLISRWNLESIVSTVAGLAALGVAGFPPAPIHNPTALQQKVDVLHHSFAVLFFLCMFVIVFFFFTSPIGPRPWAPEWAKLTAMNKQRNWIYIICGLIIAICGVGMLLWGVLSDPGTTGPNTVVFVGETTSVYVFAFAWLVKGAAVRPLND